MEQEFTLRMDQNGLRPVFLLGNLRGSCPYRCKFCSVGKSPKVTPGWNMRAFEEQYAKHINSIKGAYHPVIYNRGNITNPEEFSQETLGHILEKFDNDSRVRFLSINSRERFATPKLLGWLAGKNLSFPIHFIFGVESLSKNAVRVLGKNTVGELKRFIDKLKPFNQRRNENSAKRYVFGLDVNLVFLEELYLKKGETRRNCRKIGEGIKNDLEQLLESADQDVPMEINIHPFHRVESLPYKDASLDTFMGLLPELQKMVGRHNTTSSTQTHLFIGVEGKGYRGKSERKQIQKWNSAIGEFNRTGSLPFNLTAAGN